MILNELSRWLVTTELAHQHRDSQSFLVSQLGLHCFEGSHWRAFIVVAEDRLVTIQVASWSVVEARVKLEVKSDRLNANIGVVVHLSDTLSHAVVEALELNSLGHSRNQQQWISNCISYKRLIDQFVGYNIGVALEIFGYCFPVIYELFVHVVVGVVEVVKDVAHVACQVVLGPVALVAVLPVRHSRCVHGHFFQAPWIGEGLIAFDFVNQPHRNTISAELFRNDVLVEVDESVYSVFAQFVDELDHLLQICCVVPIFFGLYSGPPMQSNSYMAPKRTPFMPSSLQISQSRVAKDLSESKWSRMGKQGGILTTTQPPWIISSRPRSSTSIRLWFMRTPHSTSESRAVWSRRVTRLMFMNKIILNPLSMERQSKVNTVRLSLSEVKLSAEEIYRGAFTLSYKNVGDQLTHFDNLHNQLVRNYKWLSQTQLKELKELCWSIPGSTTIQVLITIATIKMLSLMAGVKCFLAYSILPWITLTITGLLSSYLVAHTESPLMLKLFFMGCNAASAGIMVRCFIYFFSQTWYSWPKVGLTLLTAIIFFYFRSIGSIVFCLLMTSTLSIYIQVEQVRQKMSSKSSDLFKNLTFNFIMGKPSLILLLMLLFGMWLFFSIYPNSSYSYIFGFYFVGCMVVGPMDSSFAFFLATLHAFGNLQIQQIWFAIPLANLLPGSHLNIGIYFGAMIDGVRGAILSAFFLYLPSFLALFGLMPQWTNYRDRQGVQRLIEGLVACSSGLSLSVIMMTLQHCFGFDVGCAIVIFILCSYINCIMNHYTYFLVIMGGMFSVFRYYSIQCYRFRRYCPFPFNY